MRLIDLGVGDVTRPLPQAVVRALHEAADEMARPETFRGYGPYAGYEFLRAEIAAHDFGARGVTVGVDEVFVSDVSPPTSLRSLVYQPCLRVLLTRKPVG